VPLICGNLRCKISASVNDAEIQSGYWSVGSPRIASVGLKSNGRWLV
jgi:hypothetical protein